MEDIKHTNPYPKYEKDRLRFKERNDCTVVTFAEVFNTTYDKAHEHLKVNCGRLNRKGLKTIQLLAPSLKRTKFKVGPYTKQNAITIGQFVKKHPIGRYYVCVRGHALAIIDGVVCDHSERFRRKIIFAMRVYLED